MLDWYTTLSSSDKVTSVFMTKAKKVRHTVVSRVSTRRCSTVSPDFQHTGRLTCAKSEVGWPYCSALTLLVCDTWYACWFEHTLMLQCQFGSISGLLVQKSAGKQKYWVQEIPQIGGYLLQIVLQVQHAWALSIQLGKMAKWELTREAAVVIFPLLPLSQLLNSSHSQCTHLDYSATPLLAQSQILLPVP